MERPAARQSHGVQDRIGRAFERWGHLAVRARWLVITGVLALVSVLGLQLPRLALDNSVEAFLHDDDPTLIRYNAFRDRFGRDDVTLIAIEPPEVFDLAFLEDLRSLHEELENEVPYLDEVTSLINARSTRGDGDTLIVGDLLEDWPRNAEDLEALKRRVLANPLYRNTLISGDGRITTISIRSVTYSPASPGSQEFDGFDDDAGAPVQEGDRHTFLTDLESAALVRAVQEVITRHQRPGVEMHLAGAAVVEARLVVAMESDLTRFLAVSVLVVVVVLQFVFRRVAGVILPLATMLLSLISTLGLMALLEIPLSLTTEILPPFLLTVGVCYSVHILVIFFQALAGGAGREEAIVYALGHSGLAVVLAALTTAGGLFSFAWAEVAPVSELGLVGPIGVVLAMLFSLVLLPALLAVVPLRLGARARRGSNRPLQRFVVGCGRISARHPWWAVAASALVLALIGAGAARLRVANDYMLWFPDDEPLKTATRFIDRELNGVVTLEAVIELDEENGLHRPSLLRRIEALSAANESVRLGELFIGKTISLVDVLKETHQALNENRPEFYAVPDDRLLISQELLLFENSGTDDLEELVDSLFTTARISMKLPWADWMLYPRFLEEMQEHVTTILGDGVRVSLTGFSAVMARAAASFNLTMIRSYVLALLIITPLMIFLVGSLRIGLLSMAPNLAPVLLTLGVMGWLDIPLDMSTLLIGGIIIGIAVDDTIHFMHGFQRRYAATGDAHRAVRETLETTGVAMLFTSVTLTAGFLVFTLAYMSNLAAFGALSAFAALTAFLADVTLAPALMVLVARRRSSTA